MMRRSALVGIITALAASGMAKSAPLPLSTQQADLCRLHYKFINDTNAYNKAVSSMNSIQRASAPQPLQMLNYAVQFAKDVGESGDFKDWTGSIQFIANTGDRTVYLDIEFPCTPDTNGGKQFGFSDTIPSVRNRGGPVLSDWDKYLAGNGYRGIPLDGAMASGLAQIPNDGRPHYVRFSGHLLYLPSVLGTNAPPTFARPDASPNPFNISDMMFVFRITALTIYR